MRMRKGFTLIELMIVIIIVAILAAVVVPLLLSRIEDAKYSEGEAILGQVATVVRAHAAENGSGTYSLAQLGFKSQELDSKYFAQAGIGPASGIAVSVDTTTGLLSYTITISPRASSGLSDTIQLACSNNITTITRSTPAP